MSESTTTATVRDLLRGNQLVTVIGARGTGKTTIADELREAWAAAGISVLALDAGVADGPEDLDRPLAGALECDPAALTAATLPPDLIIRILVDRCERLHSNPWLTGLQERWRALLSSQAARGKVAAVLFGRPLFRQIAGGAGSPLLNLGPVITVRPLTQADIEQHFSVDPACAAVVMRKTGGHPRLADALITAIRGDQARLGDEIDSFVSAHGHYLRRLAEDHAVPGQAILGDLLEARGPVPREVLIKAHFGSRGQGFETLEDLVASGLARISAEGACEIGADLLRNVPNLRELLRIPDALVPVEDPGSLEEGARLLYLVENRLRELVIQSLRAADDTWWLTRVPPEIAGGAESRRRTERDLLGVDDPPLHPLMYLSLGELFDVIYEQDNWDQIFRTALPIGRSGVEDAAQRILTVRNRIAHSRPVSEAAIGELGNAAQRLGLLAD